MLPIQGACSRRLSAFFQWSGNGDCIFFLFAAHLRKAGMFFHEDGFGAVGNHIVQSVLGSKHCLTKDISMVLESGSQGIQLLYKSSDFVKKATFNPKVDYFAPKA